ncbi:MAG: hypothetical protein WD847_21080 [Pirellulales bacterium]
MIFPEAAGQGNSGCKSRANRLEWWQGQSMSMSKKPIKRRERTDRISAEQAARDRTIRQQVEEEFPPKRKTPPG